MDWARWPRREDTQKDVSLTAGRAMGLEKKDFAAVFQVLAKMAGVNE